MSHVAESADFRQVPVLADSIAKNHVRTALLIAGGALLTALAAQISFAVPGSPVPISGQTLAVVLVGASLGSSRGLSAIALYVVMGFFLPVYSDGSSGFHHLLGATGGYIVGFMAAAWVVGFLAEHGTDRKVATAFLSFVAAQCIVFGFGLVGLKLYSGETLSWVIHNGFTIFIVGGLVKAAVGAVLMPSAWKVLQLTNKDSR
ncbi:MAG: biotin transporter BioY [Thermoleophilia bacterium]|nr:biotin transporter BioY [Thermoleophilia bacterium]